MFNNYEKYLEEIDKFLQSCFEMQSEYISCKLGCCHCCTTGEYPFSELEFKYAKLGFDNLDDSDKQIIKNKIAELKTLKKKSKKKPFIYECPFLVDSKCKIYKYRSLVCRTHGLISVVPSKNGGLETIVPLCINMGLNYSQVYDKTNSIISNELCDSIGFKEKPLGFKIGLDSLKNVPIAKTLKLNFGEAKALIDWF